MAIKRYNTNQTLTDSGFRQLSGCTLTLSANNIIGDTGTLSYANCVHDSYTARSVVDAEFVTGSTSNIINIGEPQQVIFRDIDGITGATGFLFDESISGVTIPYLYLSELPPDSGRGGVGDEYILTWDDITNQVAKTPITTSLGLQSAENGLSASGSIVRLGGDLTQCTIIGGGSEHQMIFRNLGGACIATTEGNIILDSRLNTGGIYLKSQAGTGNTAASFTNAVGIEIEYENNSFRVHDNRSSFNRSGIEYAADYSPRYTLRSLVDKQYVDTIASGLQPKQAVAVATTGETNNIDLSETGLTTYNIDGVTIGENDRVLIKDQNNAVENGIYIITSGGTWQRAEDFDEDSEVVQGSYTFVVSGQTNESTQWVVTTANPIEVDVSSVNFTLFNRINNIVGGNGIQVINNQGEFIVNLGGQLTEDVVFNDGLLNYDDDYSTSFSANTLITKSYVDNIVSTSGVVIEDEGDTVLSGVTHINFIGADVKAQNAENGGIKRVNVYIPTPEYVSNFNSTNGTNNTEVDNISTTNRYIALPDIEGTPYKVGDWDGGGLSAPTIRDNVNILEYTSNQFSIYDDNSTTFEVIVYDANGSTELRQHIITLSGNTSQTSDDITINVSSFSSDTDRFKANVQVLIDIESILPEGGRFSVKLTHDNGVDGTYTFEEDDIFRDNEALTAEFGGTAELTVVPEVPITKYISGVQFYTTLTEWRVDLNQINNLNSRSYPITRQVSITSTNFAIDNTIDINGEDTTTFNSGTWSQQHDTTNAEYTKLDWITTYFNDGMSNWDHGATSIDTTRATATIYDWTNMGSINSPSYDYLIDTYEVDSTRNFEGFKGEDHPTYPRLEDDLTTPWDSTESLVTADGGGGLQVLANRLVYPISDFTGFMPSTQPDYSGLFGDRTYYRRFETNGNTVQAGIIELDSNIVESDLDDNYVMIELSIDDGSTWYTLNEDYAEDNFASSNGCRTFKGIYNLSGSKQLAFTLGFTGTTYIHLKITFTETANVRYISTIDLTGDSTVGGTNWD
ncbi:MAG: hypothetical protein ACOCZ5_00330 [bacterium]